MNDLSLSLLDPIAQHSQKSLLRFLTCGSVDDGKSTLIGRLLYDSRAVYSDQLAEISSADTQLETVKDLDFALLVDGLQAEREQGITIDVAYRYFSTRRRKFIVADTPGHEQYTRNMATGASTCELAVILIDAQRGISTQTHRHAYIVSLLGIKHIVLAVNKIDLVGFDERVFRDEVANFMSFAQRLGFSEIVAIPLSARYGDNVGRRSENTGWYNGPSLLEYLEIVEVEQTESAGPFRMPIQYVNRPGSTFRGYCGTIASGSIHPGDEVVVAGSGQGSRVARIVAYGGDLDHASAGDAVTLTLETTVDVSRGDLLAAPRRRPEVSDQLAANLVWLDSEPMVPGRQYLLKIGTTTVPATVTQLKHKVDVDTLEHCAARTLGLNEIGLVNLNSLAAIAFDPYCENRTTGGFILIDRVRNMTLGAGIILYGLRRAANLTWQPTHVDKVARSGIKGQRPAVLWFTGLSGAGKSTIANLAEQKLQGLGRHTMLLDGDNIRHGLNRDLGFTEVDRVENIRRVAEVAKLFVEAGLIVLVSFISPFRAERRLAREMMAEGEFIEIFVDTPVEVCAQRDPKGLYQKAAQGRLKNLTGVDSPYEPPELAELHLQTESDTAERLSRTVLDFLDRNGYLSVRS
jgi:bifunctional enzyme CysN/CysC